MAASLQRISISPNAMASEYAQTHLRFALLSNSPTLLLSLLFWLPTLQLSYSPSLLLPTRLLSALRRILSLENSWISLFFRWHSRANGPDSIDFLVLTVRSARIESRLHNNASYHEPVFSFSTSESGALKPENYECVLKKNDDFSYKMVSEWERKRAPSESPLDD